MGSHFSLGPLLPMLSLFTALKNKSFFNVYFSERERESECVSEGVVERGEDTESKEAPGSELLAQSLTWGLNPRTGRS